MKFALKALLIVYIICGVVVDLGNIVLAIVTLPNIVTYTLVDSCLVFLFIVICTSMLYTFNWSLLCSISDIAKQLDRYE